MMLNEPGAGFQVRGELYDIETERLPAMDAMEHIGEQGHDRITIEVEPLNGGERVSAIAYVKDRALATPIHTGWLEDYQDRRFVPP